MGSFDLYLTSSTKPPSCRCKARVQGKGRRDRRRGAGASRRACADDWLLSDLWCAGSLSRLLRTSLTASHTVRAASL